MAKERVEIDILAKTKESVKNIAKFTVGIFAAVKALQTIGRVVKGSMDAYMKSEKAIAKLNAALKATGGVVGFSTKEMVKYADELSRATGISEDAIVEAEALMVTFTQIGKETFPQALEAAADMSAMFGQDLQQSVIQLGTALNDPIAGVGRLKKIGISFTEDQRESIKTYMEQNDIMAAQRVILDELGAEFGGVAKAMGDTTEGQIKKFNSALEELSAGFGEMTAKLLGPLAEGFATFIQDNKSTIVAVFRNLPGIARDTFKLIVEIISAALKWDNFKVIIGALWEGFLKAAQVVVEALPKLFINFLDFLTKPFQEFGRWLIEMFANSWAKIKNAGIDALNKLLNVVGVNIEKSVVPSVRTFGQVWDDTLSGMAIAGTALVTETADAIKSLAIVAGDTVAAVFAPFDSKIRAFISKITAMIAVTKKEIESIPGVAAGAPKPPPAAEAESPYTQQLTDLDLLIELTDERIAREQEVRDKLIQFTEDIEQARADAAQKEIDRQTELFAGLTENLMSVGEIFGEALASGVDFWDALADAGKNAIATILEALAEQLAVQAIAAFAEGFANPIMFAAAAGFAAGAAAASIAAGLVKGLAEGGVVTKPTLAMIGEAGPEAVIPLSKAGGMGTTIVYNIRGSMLADRDMIQHIIKGQGREFRGH